MEKESLIAYLLKRKMADIFGLSGSPDKNVSTPDTGKGSQLKTGGRRKHNMPSKSKRLIACMKKAKGNASKVKVCKIQFAAQTNTAKQHGWKPKG